MKLREIAGKISLQVFMTVVALVTLIPILSVISYSFKTRRELFVGNPLALPQTLNWDNYMTAIQRLNMGTTFFNTLLYTVVSVVLLALLSSAAAWVIARNRSRFFRFSYIYFVIGIMIPFQALFLPIYIIGYTLHLTNTVYGIILMYIATGISFSVFLMTSFMSQMPVELEEAALIDGSSLYRTFFQVVLPLLAPAVAALVIIQAFLIWNDYLMASLFVSDKGLKTINVFLQQLFSSEASDYTPAMAAIVLSGVPITVLFIVLQKYFIKGMLSGGIKG